MKKIFLILFSLTLNFLTFAQDKQCGQLPVINPTEKAVCNSDANKILNDNLPIIFNKKDNYQASYKIILDCNGIIEFVVYKRGNLNTEQQKYFLTQINKLKDWTVAKQNGHEVSSVIYLEIKVNNRKVDYKFYN